MKTRRRELEARVALLTEPARSTLRGVLEGRVAASRAADLARRRRELRRLVEREAAFPLDERDDRV